ncbi:MAG: T9SS type A sorting domain-containing protein [Ignavibacteria bacterium]|nr:T9SS type A sorting domain-containing protein [Ignavibacteria bacterium]
MYQGNFLLDSNLTSGISEGCSSPKVRIYQNKLFLAYLKTVNSVQKMVITKGVIGTDFRLNNISSEEITLPKSVSGINFSNGFSSFPSEDGFINYNYDTLGSVHTMGINLGNYSDKNIFTGNYTGRNINGVGSLLGIVTDNNSSSYYFTAFGWLRKSNDSSMISANGHYNYSTSGITKSFYLGDSTVNSSIDISNHFPNGLINAYRFRLVWERKINNRTSIVESRFDDHLSDINSEAGIVSDYKLEQNYPNPFNPSTVINYSIKEKGFVTLRIYNSLGKEVSTPVSQIQNAGRYSVVWSAGNFPSGVYYYQMKTEGITVSKKMIVMK